MYQVEKDPGRLEDHTMHHPIPAPFSRAASPLAGVAAALVLSALALAPAPILAQDDEHHGDHQEGQQGRTLEAEMQAAMEALPTELRAGAGLIRFGEGEGVIWVREPENNVVCNLDDPEDDGFYVRCYHRDMWPAVRHWQAVYQEVDGDRKAAYREFDRQVREGEFEMHTAPSMGYAMQGPDYSYSWETGAIRSEMAKWQEIYVPFATAEDLGATQYREHSEHGLPGFMPFVQVPGTAFSRITVQHEAW